MEFLRVITIIILMSIICLVLNSVKSYFLEYADKKFSLNVLREGTNYKVKQSCLTIQGKVVLIFFSVTLIPLPSLFLSEFNYFFNLGVFLSFLLPGLMLLLRIHTFNEDNVYSETGLGYDPILSWILAFLALSMGFAIGFSDLYFNYIPKYIPFVLILLAFLSSLIPIFPDKINKYLSFDIRSGKGVWVLKILTAVAIFIQSLFFLYSSLFLL